MVMGWHMSVHRQTRRRGTPSSNRRPKGPHLATWQAGLSGLDWLKDLVATEDAVHLADNAGFPVRYSVRAGAAIPIILEGPPHARTRWIAEPTDIIVDVDRWHGQTTIDHSALATCRPDEWLQVDAWDQS